MGAEQGVKFTCQICKGSFKALRSHEEALEVAKAQWGDALPDDPEQQGVVCEDCHEVFMAWFRSRQH